MDEHFDILEELLNDEDLKIADQFEVLDLTSQLIEANMIAYKELAK